MHMKTMFTKYLPALMSSLQDIAFIVRLKIPLEPFHKIFIFLMPIRNYQDKIVSKLEIKLEKSLGGWRSKGLGIKCKR